VENSDNTVLLFRVFIYKLIQTAKLNKKRIYYPSDFRSYLWLKTMLTSTYSQEFRWLCSSFQRTFCLSN